ncbi:MAG: hypothetical protein B7Z81_05235 [Acidocella sp. 20-61-6]|nr:MAG: hypothetical protein B7Z81_05235 [Acidocella sp. 20-61-6]
MRIWRLLASGFGVGYAPRAPGTFGALLGLALGTLLLAIAHWVLLLGIVAVTALGLIAIERLNEAAADPGWIVIDEIAGQMVPLLMLPRIGWAGLAVSFALFRLLDITKPGPVGWADARHDAFGVMGDDLIAGGLAALVLLAVETFLVPVLTN